MLMTKLQKKLFDKANNLKKMQIPVPTSSLDSILDEIQKDLSDSTQNKLYFENALVDGGIVSSADMKQVLADRLITIDDTASKNKIKKATKKNHRIETTIKNVDKMRFHWFSYPNGTKIKGVHKASVVNVLGAICEYLGTMPLDSELIAYHSQQMAKSSK